MDSTHLAWYSLRTPSFHVGNGNLHDLTTFSVHSKGRFGRFLYRYGSLPLRDRMHKGRDVLRAQSIQDVVSIVSVEGRACGISFNAGSLLTKEMINLEMAAGTLDNFPFHLSPDSYNILQITSNFTHVNEYRHLNVSQQPDPSSQHRLARINQIAAGK